MKIAFIVENALRKPDLWTFDGNASCFHQDGRNFWMLRLRDCLLSNSADIAIASKPKDLEAADIHIFFDVCDTNLLDYSAQMNVVRILIELESPAIRDNRPWLGCGLWNSVFGHRPRSDINEKFKFFVLPTELGEVPTRVIHSLNSRLLSQKGLVIVANNKTARKSDTYAFRREIIRFLIQEGMDVDLFGSGWDIKQVNNWLASKLFNLLHIRTNEFQSIYRGMLSSKESLCGRYRFNLCLENSYPKYPWFFSEKLAESFYVGGLPIYLGSKVVGERLGFEGVVYASDFRSVEECLCFAAALDSTSYEERLSAYLGSFDSVRSSIACSRVAAAGMSDHILSLL